MSEHFPPDIGSRQAQSRLRLRFLAVLDEMHRRVLDELRALWGDFKPTYEAESRRESESTSDNDVHSETRDWTEPISRGFLDWYHDGVENGNTTVEQLNKRLDKWAEQFNIRCPWIIEAALSTINTWERVPEAEKKRGWFWHPASIWTPLDEGEQEFLFTGRWNPLHERADDARRRIKGALDRQFGDWFNETLSTATERGYQSPPAAPREEDHVRWLVRYQVVGESPEKIFLDAQGIDSFQAIQSAVNKMADRIGLKRRTGKRGPARNS